MCSVQCSVCSVQCEVCSVQCGKYLQCLFAESSMTSSVVLLLCTLVVWDQWPFTDSTDVTLVAGEQWPSSDSTDVTLVAGEQCSNQCGGRREDWCDGECAVCSV